MAKIELFDGTNWITLGNGTVTSVDISGSTGLTVSGSPITNSGGISLTLSAQLQALSILSSTGFIVRTGTNTFTTRNFGISGFGISVTNSTGVTGNPTFALTSQLQSLSVLSVNGLITRTASGTLVARTLTSGTGISITNGDGVNGNPSVSLENIIASPGTFSYPVSITLDSTGRITDVIGSVSPPAGLVTLTGDVTGSGTGTVATTLANSIIKTTTQTFDFSSDTSTFNLFCPNGANKSISFVMARNLGSNIPYGFEFNMSVNSGGNNIFKLRFNNQNFSYTDIFSVVDTTPEFIFNFYRIRQILDPLIASDAATKGYVDSLVTTQLQALSSLSTTGIMIRTGTNTFATRTLAVGDGLTLMNADGVSGNPTINLHPSLTDIANLISTSQGFLARNSTGAVYTRTFSVGLGLNINFGNGISGNPNIFLGDILYSIASIGSGTGFLVRTSSSGSTSALRTISGSGGISVANGDGISGNPTISLAGPIALTVSSNGQTFGSAGLIGINNTNTTTGYSGMIFQRNGVDYFELLIPNFSPGYAYFGTESTNGLIFKTNGTSRIALEQGSGKVRFFESLKELQIRAASNYLDLRGANVRGSKQSAILETNALNETASIVMNGDYIQLIQPFTDLGVIFTDEDNTISTSWQSYISSSGALVTSSSRKIKHSIRQKKHKNYLERLNKLNVYSYALKSPIEDSDTEKKKNRKYFKNKRLHVGLISEEVAELFDNCTDNFKTIDFDKNNITEIQKSVNNYTPTIEEEEYINHVNKERGEVIGIKYDTMLCYTILALQELTKKVELMENKLR